MSWTEEKVSQLRELWDQGLPTSQIGKILDFSKNAVVGKAHRIGLERRPSPIKRSIMKPDRKKARAPLMPLVRLAGVRRRFIDVHVVQKVIFVLIVKNVENL